MFCISDVTTLKFFRLAEDLSELPGYLCNPMYLCNLIYLSIYLGMRVIYFRSEHIR